MLALLVWSLFSTIASAPALDPADRGQAPVDPPPFEDVGWCSGVPLLASTGAAGFAADALIVVGGAGGLWILTTAKEVPDNVAWVAPALLAAAPLGAGALIFMVPWAVQTSCGGGRALDTGAASLAAFLGAGVGGAAAGGLAGYLGGWLYGSFAPRNNLDAPYFAMQGATVVALWAALATAPVGAAAAAWAMSRVPE